MTRATIAITRATIAITRATIALTRATIAVVSATAPIGPVRNAIRRAASDFRSPAPRSAR